ncbi:MAG: TlpA family protein disulfide reductase [Bacillota bacterium]
MKFSKQLKLVILFILVVSLLVLAGCSFNKRNANQSQDRPVKAKVDFKAPNFTLPTLKQKQINLSDYKDRVILINFWATWCPPCRAEMPYIQQLNEEMSDKVKILAINVREKPTQVKEFIKKNNYNFTILMDQEAEVANKYLVRGVPKTIVINRNGIIKGEHVGSMNLEQMKSLINQAL